MAPMTTTTTTTTTHRQLRRLLLVAIPLLLQIQLVACFEFDKDTGKLCKEKAQKDYCIKDPHAYFDCPITCARHYRPERAHWGGLEKKENPIYDMSFEGSHGKHIHLHDYEGLITLFCTIPLYPGLSQFNYQLLTYIRSLHKHLIEIIIIPMEGQDGVQIHQNQNSKVKLLHGVHSPSHPLVAYLSTKIQQGKFDPTQLNCFMLSANGDNIYMHVYPDFHILQRYIRHRLDDLNDEF